MSRKIVAGNWKMNMEVDQAKELFDQINDSQYPNDVNVVLCPPSIYLSELSGKCENINLASQNVSNQSNGAYTGEVSAKMLSSISVPFSLVGHSERREIFGESDDIVFAKTRLLLENNITPIFCCGEPINIRKDNTHLSFVEEQLNLSVFKLKSSEFKKIIIAYEPVWAIGTGETASENDISEMHRHIRSLIKSKYSSSLSNDISILYGGSVKPENAKQIFDIKNVDGGLIGGASLNAKDFIDIVNSIN